MPFTPASSVAGVVWPALPSGPGQTMLAAQFQFEQTQWWTAAELAARQLGQLRELAAHALAQAPHYREEVGRALPELLTDPRALTWEQFARWPLLEKSALRGRERLLRASALPPSHGQVFWHATTGSTGTPVRVASTTVSQFFRAALVLRNQLWHGLDFRRVYAEIKPETGRGRHPDWGGGAAAAYATGALTTLNVAAGLDEQLDWLIAEAPAYLQAKSSNLRALLQRSRETGRAPRGMDALLSFSENLPADLRALARELWGARVIDTYSCGEAGVLALQCPTCESYHVQSELILLEVLDDEGRPCAPGETGRVVITDLTNFATPLIRYALGDYAVAGTPCDCGRGLAVIERIVGRERNMAVDPDGRVFWPTFPPDFWFDLAPFRQIQMVQRTPAQIEIRYVMERDIADTERETLTAALNARMGYPFEYRYTRVEAIARSPREKFEEFICLCLPGA